MQLKALRSFEDLPGTVDLICIPASKETMDSLHKDVLSLMVPSETLPPVSELHFQKHTLHLFYGQWNNRRIKLLVGYEGDKLTEANLYNVVKRLSIRAKSENSEKVGLMMHNIDTSELIVSAFSGWTAGQYDLGLYKNNAEENPKKTIRAVYSYLNSEMEKAALEGITIGLVQQEVMDLVNTPASHKAPSLLGDWAKKSGEQYGYEVNVIDKNELTDLGMHALLAVNRGSEHPAQCIV